MTTTLSPWQHAQELFAANLDGYQDRPQQTALANKVSEALDSTTPLLGQAGCGCGKSLATLVPAIHWSLERGEPVVISTATKALMDQVSNKDLPFMQPLLAEAGMPFTFAVVKGRSNYACLAKLKDPQARALPYHDALTQELETEGQTGDLDSLITTVPDRDKSLVTSTSDECPGTSCPLKDACFAERAKAKAKRAQIIVTNHALLVTDAQVKRMSNQEFGMLPRLGAVIVDECFPAGTPVDGRPIEEIKVGDEVSAFNEETGQMESRRVTRLYRNPVGEQLVEVTVEGRRILATPGHPFWTQRGWVEAMSLKTTDSLLTYGQASQAHASGYDVRLVLGSGSSGVAPGVQQLREDGAGLLLSGARSVGEGKGDFAGVGGPAQGMGATAHAAEQSHELLGVSGEDARDVAGNGASAMVAGREWHRDDRAAEAAAGAVGVRMDPRVRRDGRAGAQQRVAHALQDRSGASGSDGRGGDRRAIALGTGAQEAGSEEGRVLAWSRVDRVEVHERAGDARFGGLCPDGHVYNIEVEGLHTYTAHGVVVHNCHELEDYATNMLGSQVTSRGIEKISSQVTEFLGDHQKVGPLLLTTKTLFAGLEGMLRRDKTKRLDVELIGDEGDGLIGDALKDLAAALHKLAQEVEAEKIMGDDHKLVVQRRLQRGLASLRQKVLSIRDADADELVRWVEREDRGVILKFAPLHVSAFLRENIWSHAEIRGSEDRIAVPARPRPSVLVSATLSTSPGDFSFIARALGLDEMGFQGFDAGTPFDYRKQAKLFIPPARTASDPKGMPEPGDGMWRNKAQTTMRELVIAAGGRSLLLFTSGEAMAQAYEALADGFDELGFTPYMQGQYSNPVLSEKFKSDERSVLFAMKSFMTGFDAQGDSLRLVILDKLPFAVPTDVINKARCDAAERRVMETYRVDAKRAFFHPEGPFKGITIPAATLVAMQAMGRLIRTVTDEGLMVILDVRLDTKFYGKQIIKALPNSPRLDTMAEARSYLTELAARRD
jgi:Rad3-related DNA helicase